ncbi:MAG: hypothetical protein HY901_07600 [Deltaproteobacteria bacterium]|nr:hypothetical protein [Deltaproteobacteria bacterium]
MEPPLAAALLTAICIVACLDPIKSADLECGKNGCLDASLADASPPVADAGTDAGGDAEVPRLDAEVRDAESPGIDADLPGLDADLPALDGGPTDAEAPDASRDASSPDAAPCTLLFSLGYPSGQVLETTCLRDIPHLRAGPCSGADDCHLDSRAFYPALTAGSSSR